MTRSGERGQALLAALIVSLLLGTACASLVILSVANTTASQTGVRRAVALTTAEIGVERAKASIVDGVLESQFDVHGHQAVQNDEVYAPDGDLYGTYAVKVTEDHGGIEGQYLVVSQGTSGQTTRQINVVLRRTPITVPDQLAAITLHNPNALSVFCGVPPNVCGMDTDLPSGINFPDVRASDCTPGSGDGPHAVGIGVHDDQSVTDILAALGSRTDRVTGVSDNGTSEDGSVYNVTVENPTGQIDDSTASDICDLAEACEAVADYVYDSHCWFNGHGKVVEDGSFGTTSDPKVVVLRDPTSSKVKLAGCLTGVGVLIIDSEVEFTGTFNYAGLIIITNRGNATVSLEMMGTPLVMGSIIAANPAEESTSVLDLRGTADIFYSREALSYAQQALTDQAKFQKLFYMEKKPNAADVQIETVPW
ncbi:MAG TPA: hypothetical protein VMZ92_07340 [Planctomycetota bacterium]|nr:hypothetical protein [Planctomycetota bacterium]